ncbi:methionyl-tRNA formyltransferase-like protein [uncultured Hyphomicrobium sp.]|jgi:hypothetical protein|uniref:methionyl-tRNA formyltransferase-like protein n=1 Tax=uncultured Hyphomicrobium sp. TaxID=194373 RepID=UPI0025F0ABB9|nr:methionyl-tRNA formyltransferase-like protein [uncultured Hyphomicrobium sp.]
MEKLDQILTRATGRVADRYFQLPIDGGDPVYRERVYCYELYHQMRVRWPQHSEYSLNGEVDKAAHPQAGLLDGTPKPDLLVHIPGTMAGNHAVIEVKSCRANAAVITIDLVKLVRFVRRFRYQRAIYLVYGYAAAQTLERVHAAVEALEDLVPIEVWLHEQPGQPAYRATILAPAEEINLAGG